MQCKMGTSDLSYFAFPERICVSDEIFNELLKEFYDETECRNLHHFALRIEGVPFCAKRPLRGAFMLRCFQNMLDEMELVEKLHNFYSLVDLLQLIMVKYLRFELVVPPVLQQLRVTLNSLLKVAKNCRPFRSFKVVFLINKFREGLGDRHFALLKLLSSEDLERILDCYQMRRFHGWNVTESCLLMTDLSMKRKHASALLFYGFSYHFERTYFEMCCRSLRNEWTEVRGKSLGIEIDYEISERGHLRLQMAVEILIVMFNKKRNDTIPILRSVWKSVAWPLISAAEMFNLLKPIYRGWYLQLEDVCEEYAARNPIFAVPKTPQPRSLRDLASVRVRKNLCDARTLSDDSINNLDIPKILKDCLKLDSSHLPE